MEIGSIFDINVNDLFQRQNTKDFSLPFMENNSLDQHYFFNTGRSAIEYLLKYLSSEVEEKKILLPAFNCSSVIDAVKRAGFEIEYYAINENMEIDTNSIMEKMDGTVRLIYIIQYFGSYQSEESYKFLKELQYSGKILIEDITHSLFTNHPNFIGFGDYILGSIRKWLPIPDGAFLSSKKEIPMQGIEGAYNEYSFKYFVAQVMKNAYLLDNSLDKTQFLELNKEANKALFSDYTIRKITDLSKSYLFSYDMHEVIKRRKNNYNYFVEKIKKYSFLKPLKLDAEGVVPFGMVILSNERDELLRYLIDNNIYCNIHWKLPKECSVTDDVSKMFSEKILTIPCDQRYDKEDIDYIIRVLDNYEISK